MQINWTTEKRKVADLKDYENNPRKFNKKGLRDLKESIKSVGYIDPIAINTDGTILGGHARKKTLLALKLKEVDVRVPDRLLTEKEQKEVVIRLNKNTAGEWDNFKLGEFFEKENLVDWGFEPEDFGGVVAQEAEYNGIEESEEIEYLCLVRLEDEESQQNFYNEMLDRDLICKIMT